MKRSIRGKLFVGFGSLLLLLMIVGVVSWWNARRLSGALYDIYEINVQRAVHLATAQNALWQLRYGFPQFLVLEGEARQKIIDDEPKWYKVIEEATEAYKSTVRTKEEESALQEWEEIFAKYKGARPKWFALQLAGKTDEAAAWRAQTTTPFGAGAVKALEQLIEHQRQSAETKQQENAAIARGQAYFLGSLLAAAVVLGLGLSGWIGWSVTRALMSIVSGLDNIRARDLTVTVPVYSNDELGRISTGMNEMVQTLHDSMVEMTHASTAVAQAAQQCSSAAEEVSVGAQQQASSLEETAAFLEEISGTIQQNAGNAEQANQLAINSWKVAEKGGQIVSSTVSAMYEINESSRKITDIITVIDEIAFQTNLLALNAAVEAARAGEQGRGFAVVAAEVRNLAQRSATAAKEIKSLINDSTQRVQHGAELVTKSGQTLEEIVTSVKRVMDIVSDIAAASREQANGIEQVNRAVTQMDQVVQANSAQTEEMSATSQKLSTQAKQLQSLVSRFKLKQQSPQPDRWEAPELLAVKTDMSKPQAAPKGYVNGHANGHGNSHAYQANSFEEC